jgi:hypothetical protein
MKIENRNRLSLPLFTNIQMNNTINRVTLLIILTLLSVIHVRMELYKVRRFK